MADTYSCTPREILEMPPDEFRVSRQMLIARNKKREAEAQKHG